jgi:DNA-binding CsgD family transcriptional regulator
LVADLGRAQVAALRGDDATASRLADEAERVLLSLGVHPMLSLVMQVRAVAALAGGRFEEAFDHLHRVFDPADIAHHPYARLRLLGYLTDAGVGCGRLDAVRAMAEKLTPLLASTGSPALRIGLAYTSALLADDSTAEALFVTALGRDLAGWPFDRARLHLAYGRWLRRTRRPSESRTHLRAAITTFDALGTAPWAEFARRELRASGETLRRADDARDRLTPQEIQIAQLAAEGLSNRDIAARLFLSPRTVGTHLYRIYPKLGVSSRAELARLMSAGTDR